MIHLRLKNRSSETVVSRSVWIKFEILRTLLKVIDIMQNFIIFGMKSVAIWFLILVVIIDPCFNLKSNSITYLFLPCFCQFNFKMHINISLSLSHTHTKQSIQRHIHTKQSIQIHMKESIQMHIHLHLKPSAYQIILLIKRAFSDLYLDKCSEEDVSRHWNIY